MMFTNNAAPLNNTFTVDRVSPFRLPWVFRYLGDIRFRRFHRSHDGTAISDHCVLRFDHFDYPGTIWKESASRTIPERRKDQFQAEPNFEFGMSKTTVYGGPGNPLNITTFLDSAFGKHYHGDVLGDGRTSADFSYRIPGFVIGSPSMAKP